MPIIFGLIAMLISFGAFAQENVSVVIDGKTYQCVGSGENQCVERVERAKAKFEACKKAGNFVSDCFYGAYKNTEENKECAQWSEDCNSLCKSVGGFTSDCYNYCY